MQRESRAFFIYARYYAAAYLQNSATAITRLRSRDVKTCTARRDIFFVTHRASDFIPNEWITRNSAAMSAVKAETSHQKTYRSGRKKNNVNINIKS